MTLFFTVQAGELLLHVTKEDADCRISLTESLTHEQARELQAAAEKFLAGVNPYSTRG